MHILVIGDACIDEYRFGTIDRVNPESTAPLLNYHTKEERLGMAHNVANNLKALGAVVTLSVPDEVSRKIRYIDKRTGNHLLRIDHDVQCEPYEPKDFYKYDAIVISDYNKGYLTTEAIRTIRNNFAGLIYMDTKKTDLAKFNGIKLKINDLEYRRAISLNDDYVITHGAKGCSYGGKLYPAEKIEVVDVCGAGDVFLSAMVYVHLKTDDMDRALVYANKAAATSCTKLGTVCVS